MRSKASTGRKIMQLYILWWFFNEYMHENHTYSTLMTKNMMFTLLSHVKDIFMNIKVVMEYQLCIKVEQNDGYSWWFKCVWAFAALAHCDKKTMRNFCETSHIKPKYDSLDGVVKCHTAGFSLLGVEASPSQLA